MSSAVASATPPPAPGPCRDLRVRTRQLLALLRTWGDMWQRIPSDPDWAGWQMAGGRMTERLINTLAQSSSRRGEGCGERREEVEAQVIVRLLSKCALLALSLASTETSLSLNINSRAKRNHPHWVNANRIRQMASEKSSVVGAHDMTTEDCSLFCQLLLLRFMQHTMTASLRSNSDTFSARTIGWTE